MSLQLDARQRAMLGEIGIRVFAPDSDFVEGRAPPAYGSPPDLARQAEGSADLRPAGSATPVVVTAPTPALPRRERQEQIQRTPGVAGLEWDALAQAVAQCRACGLCEGRTQTVFGVGDKRAEWMVVGEAPGEYEDQQGEPFLGDYGKLLDNMLASLGVSRRQGAYIANLLKCRPPGNRNPLPQEIAQCEPFLRRQVELLQPKVILAMGRFAIQALLQTTEPVGKLRGQVYRYQDVPVVVTYHPAYLLRNLQDKAKAWADLCLARRVMQQGI